MSREVLKFVAAALGNVENPDTSIATEWSHTGTPTPH
jgi:hypothetical protein